MAEHVIAEEESLSEIFVQLSPTPASYISACRRLESYVGDDLQPLRVGILSSFTAEILRPYLVVEGARRGNRILVNFCPFNQIEVQAFNPTSELYQAKPEVIVVALRLEDIAPQLMWSYASLSVSEVEIECAKLQERLQSLLTQIRQESDAAILVFNFSLPAFFDAGFADTWLEISQSSAVSRANDILMKLCRGQSDTFVFDYAWLTAKFGLTRWYDPKLLYTARIPFGMEAQLELGRYLARYVRAVFSPPCKCLVLDLDNTLWGGVLGEDGLGGIALGEDYPGNIYKEFQRRLLSLRDQGILLALASKNNEAEVITAFQRHPDMLLQLEDFAAYQIHWADKATSLKAIAAELNIAVDALAFFDDSPVERAWVRQNLPEVSVIEVPPDPLRYVEALEESGVFDRLIISADDRRRTDMVHQSHQRQQSRVQAGSVEEFLWGLEMTATVGHLGPMTSPRIVQLLAKTNQFNLTTRRLHSAQLQTMLDNGAIVLWMRVRDRFGDNGLVGVAIAVCEDGERWRIDSFLLSCRVLGRRIETVLLATLAHEASQRGCSVLVGEYIPTAKNTQVAEFYPSHGFVPLSENPQRWTFDLTTNKISRPEIICVEYEKDESL